MRKTRLNLALFSALALLGSSQAFATLSDTHGIVVINDGTYTADDYNNAPVEDEYAKRTITNLFVHYNAGIDATGSNFVVTGGKAFRIYAAMLGHEDLSAEDAPVHNVSNNSISVDGLSLARPSASSTQVTVIGGASVYRGTALNNRVVISNTAVDDVYGGLSHHGSAIGNEVTILTGVTSGKDGYSYVWGGLINFAEKTDNLDFGDVEQASFNRVIVRGSNEEDAEDYLQSVCGGMVRLVDHSGAIANGNEVEIHGGHVTRSYGGYSADGSATNNRVTIYRGLIATFDGTGGGWLIGGYVPKGEASNNQVVIYDGKIIGDIHAAYGTQADKVTIKNNAISILGAADLTQANLYGSNLSASEKVFGNALNLHVQQSVQSIANFQELNFYVGSELQPNDVLLKVAENTATTDISKATLNVYIDKDAKRLNPGEKITLISDSDGLVTTDFEGNIILADPIKDYRVCFNLEDNTDLVLTVFESRISPRTQSLLKGNLTRLAFVNQAGDLVADAGTNALVDAANSGRQWFVAMQGGSNHYNMDSYIDLDGQSVMFGGALSGEAWGGHLSVGAFVEGGWADYEMLDQFDNGSTMKGKGETDYRGAGLLAYYGKVVDDNRSWWAEASVRAGRADLTYATQDWVPGFDYDLNGNYFAAHVGAGYRYALSPTQSLNLFTKAFYNRQASEDFMIEANPIEFDAMESMRWRAGVAYEQLTQTASGTRFFWKTSLAYEYEFEAVARGRADGYQIQESDLTGSSGVAEFAMTVVPAALPNTDFRVAVQGYAGQREGVLGQVRLTHRF